MRTLEDSLRWMRDGTELFHRALAAEDADRLAEPSELPGWTGKHIVAHLALNAAALGNLVHWARTGEKTPMYVSAEQRAADIEAGAAREDAALRAWYAESATELHRRLAQLSGEDWNVGVETRQGREVPAADIPWMRAREAMVHAVDLGDEVYFDDLPTDFLTALVDDIIAHRSLDPVAALEILARDTGEAWRLPGAGEPVRVLAPIADLAAWLSGREGADINVIGGGESPDLSRWL